MDKLANVLHDFGAELKQDNDKAECHKERKFQRGKFQRDIHIHFAYPPIPDRNFDWHAFFDGYEPGDLEAYGPTPEAAVRELMEKSWEEAADYCEEVDSDGKY